jgi:hypothetical protein
MSTPFEKVKFTKATSNGAGKYYVEAHCWMRKAGAMHSAPDIKGIGEGEDREAAKSDAMRSALANYREYMRGCAS